MDLRLEQKVYHKDIYWGKEQNESNQIGKIYFNEEYPGFMYVKEYNKHYKAVDNMMTLNGRTY